MSSLVQKTSDFHPPYNYYTLIVKLQVRSLVQVKVLVLVLVAPFFIQQNTGREYFYQLEKLVGGNCTSLMF